jgi:hypothetical protein
MGRDVRHICKDCEKTKEEVGRLLRNGCCIPCDNNRQEWKSIDHEFKIINKRIQNLMRSPKMKDLDFILSLIKQDAEF